jgi:hypothetical protein
MTDHQFQQMLHLMNNQSRDMRRIADALETLAAIAQAEHEASDTGDTAPLTDLAGRPVR